MIEGRPEPEICRTTCVGICVRCICWSTSTSQLLRLVPPRNSCFLRKRSADQEDPTCELRALFVASDLVGAILQLPVEVRAYHFGEPLGEFIDLGWVFPQSLIGFIKPRRERRMPEFQRPKLFQDLREGNVDPDLGSAPDQSNVIVQAFTHPFRED